ncbi:MAG TPA: O-methyltransferase [Candidatus Methylomirabilis sp.]|nr:O-methyltransferase [Candidatus Methylomirabilis sp.]
MREIDHRITNPRVDNYLYAMLPERDAVLAEIEQQADERDIPIVGPAVGRLLYQYARLIGAKTVFEMGSAVGYSTIWWAMAVGDAGKVHYTDGSRKNADEARGYFARAGVADRIQVHVGDALEVLSERKEQFDVLFCDIDKPDYPRAARMAPERVRRGGLFITDNTLWRGDVVYAAGNPDYKPEYQPDQKLRAIVEFNGMLYQSPDWFTTIVPLRDGVTVAMRL